MYNSIIFSKFTEWSNYHHNSVLKHFHHPPKYHPCPVAVYPSCKCQAITLLKLLLRHLPTLRFYESRIPRLGHSYAAQKCELSPGNFKGICLSENTGLPCTCHVDT